MGNKHRKFSFEEPASEEPQLKTTFKLTDQYKGHVGRLVLFCKEFLSPDTTLDQAIETYGRTLMDKPDSFRKTGVDLSITIAQAFTYFGETQKPGLIETVTPEEWEVLADTDVRDSLFDIALRIGNRESNLYKMLDTLSNIDPKATLQRYKNPSDRILLTLFKSDFGVGYMIFLKRLVESPVIKQKFDHFDSRES